MPYNIIKYNILYSYHQTSFIRQVYNIVKELSNYYMLIIASSRAPPFRCEGHGTASKYYIGDFAREIIDDHRKCYGC